jgi:hypothetical protein
VTKVQDALKLRADGNQAPGAVPMTTAALFLLLFVFMLIGMPVAVALGCRRC